MLDDLVRTHYFVAFRLWFRSDDRNHSVCLLVALDERSKRVLEYGLAQHVENAATVVLLAYCIMLKVKQKLLAFFGLQVRPHYKRLPCAVRKQVGRHEFGPRVGDMQAPCFIDHNNEVVIWRAVNSAQSFVKRVRCINQNQISRLHQLYSLDSFLLFLRRHLELACNINKLLTTLD